MDLAELQSHIFDVFATVLILMLVVMMAWDIIKKRRWLNTSKREADELRAVLAEELDDDMVVLRNVHVMTKLGKSVADYFIVSPKGIFSLEYRPFYRNIKAPEYCKEWEYGLTVKKQPFTSNLWVAKMHICSLKELIGDSKEITYFPMAAFPTIDDFLGDFSYEKTSFVHKMDEVVPWIDYIMESDEFPVCLTDAEVKSIAELIKANSEKVKAQDNIEKPEELPEEYRSFTKSLHAGETYENYNGTPGTSASKGSDAVAPEAEAESEVNEEENDKA